MNLYRAVGLQELGLIYDSGMKSFPAGLPQQPIFYPVLQIEYARQVAQDWNSRNGDFAGYVTSFTVDDEYLGRFKEHAVGETQYQEFWIPTDELEEFNKHIVGPIKTLEGYFGETFPGFVPEKFGLQGKNIVDQFTQLTTTFLYKRMDFYLEIRRNHKAIYLNYPFWQKYNFKNPELKGKILKEIKEAWLTSFPKISLANPVQADPPAEIDQDSHPSVEPVQEKRLHSEQRKPGTLADPVRADSDLKEQTEPDSLSSPEPQEKISVRQRDTRSPDNAHPEKITPGRQPQRNLPEKAGQQDIPALHQKAPHVVRKPVFERPEPVKQSASHFEQGIKLGLSGSYREAVDALIKTVEQDPRHAVAFTSLGVAYHRLGEDDRALSCYASSLQINPKNANAHYFRANILYSQGNVREAIAEYTLALGLAPELIDAHQTDTVQDQLTDYTSIPAAMHWIARISHRILALNERLQTDPEQADLYKERASDYSRLLNYEQAIADYSSSLALQPEDITALHFRGVAYEQLGQSDRALQDYQQALTINPQLADEYVNRGIAFANMGNFRQAIASLTEAVRFAPQNPDTYFNRGMSYFQYGDLEGAIADFSEVIRLSPADEEAYYWRGISSEEIGQQQDAMDDYKKFLELSQNWQTRQDVEQRLKHWNAEKQHGVSSQNAIHKDGQKPGPMAPEEPHPIPGLHDLIDALGERALRSMWFGVGVQCVGETAGELSSLTDSNLPVSGQDFLRLAFGIQQMAAGEFAAFEADSDFPWVIIRAWQEQGFFLEIDDPKSKERLKTYFRSVEEVEGADPAYISLLVR